MEKTMKGVPEEVIQSAIEAWVASSGGMREAVTAAAQPIAEWARKEALREDAEVAARAWREGAVAILRASGIESVDRYLENLAENGHAIRALAEGGAQ